MPNFTINSLTSTAVASTDSFMKSNESGVYSKCNVSSLKSAMIPEFMNKGLESANFYTAGFNVTDVTVNLDNTVTTGIYNFNADNETAPGTKYGTAIVIRGGEPAGDTWWVTQMAIDTNNQLYIRVGVGGNLVGAQWKLIG